MEKPKTIRMFIKRRVWALTAVGFTSWLLFALSAALSDATTRKHPPPVLAVCAFVLFGAAALFLQLWVRCPKCSRRLGQTIALPVAFGGMKAPNFCPYCGVDLDTPVEKAPTPAENVTTPDKLIWK